MTDDREFDILLEEQAAGLPPDGEVTPWKRAMRRIVWGVGLTTLTLNFCYLNYLLPAAGHLMLWLGFRSLRRENRWFRLGWLLSLTRLVLAFLSYVLQGTILRWEMPGWVWLGAQVLASAAALVQLLALWRGIAAVRRAAGLSGRCAAAAALAAAYGALLALIVSGVWNTLVLLALAAVYVWILRCLSRVSGLLDGAGYLVRAAPVRLPDWGARWLWWGALAVCVPLGALLLARYPMQWTPRPEGEQAGLEEIRESLVAMQMPRQVAQDLSPEELRALEGALSVTTQVTVRGFEDSGIYRATDVAVELPGECWKILHHFLWQEEPSIRTTECIMLWPTDRLEDWRQTGELTGRLLYDADGETYVGDYYRIEVQSYAASSFLSGGGVRTEPFALFSLPREGTACRGYLTYEVEMVRRGSIIDSWSNYTHQRRWLNYPCLTAQAYEMSGIWNGFGAFDTAQTAIQFYPWGEEKGSYREYLPD